MTVITKLLNGIKKPDKILPYIYQQQNDIRALLRRGEYSRVIQRFSKQLLGTDLYWRFTLLKLKATDQYNSQVKKRVLGFDMLLDPTDVGISKELLMYGNREITSTPHYRGEVADMTDSVDGTVTVIDIGANIGYYAMMPAELLNDVQIFAIEASKENCEILTANIRANNYEDMFDVDNIALGNRSGESTLHISDRSNWHRIADESKKEADDIVTEERVDMVTFDEYVEYKGLSPEDIDVVRMDVEGYETEVIQGMREFFKDHEPPTVLFIEIHLGFFKEKSEIEKILSIIDTGSYDIISIERSDNKFESLNLTNLSVLHEVDYSVELILRYTDN